MKIPKAVEILDLNIKEAGPKMPQDTLSALKLGREALIRVKECHYPAYPDFMKPLPGETNE